jgi:hypothetical protein
MVAAVRRGAAQRSVARCFGVSLHTVQRWVERAAGQRLDRVDWPDRPAGPQHPPHRTAIDMENLIIETRDHLRQASDLGEYGAEAVHRTHLELGLSKVPSIRTINRIFDRRGVLDARHAPRRKAPPAGWYLPEVSRAQVEVDSFDLIEGLKIKDGPLVEVLNEVSLQSGLVVSWPHPAAITAKTILLALKEITYELPRRPFQE